MVRYTCGKRCGAEMEYVGYGMWLCPKCGKDAPLGDPEDDPDDEDEDTGEGLSVWDAAHIYLSKGCDEDYSFGYTHEELMEALG